MTHTDTPAAQDTPRATNLVLLFATLMVAMLLASLSQMVFSTALPTIVGELHGVDHMTWVITGYLLAATIMMPIYGKTSDLFGRKPLLLVATVMFIAGSVVGALAYNMNLLVIARVIQGLGGGGLMILSQAAVADAVPARERGKYMGAIGAVFAFSSVAGPLLGGWFTEGPGWRWAFWMNVPLGVLAVVAIVFLMPSRSVVRERPKVDTLGMALLAVATTAIVLVGTWGGSTYEWGSAQIIGLAVTGVVFAGLFVWAESRAEQPVMPLGMFTDRNFLLTTGAALLTAVAMFGAIAYLPTYFQMAKGASATNAGLLMIPMMAAMLTTSVGTGVIISRTGRYKLIPILGCVVLAGGLGLLSTSSLATPTYLICVYMAIMGVGLGAVLQILTLIVQNAFPHRIVGAATAANNYFRQVGGSLGAALVGSVFASRLTSLLLDRLPAGAASSGDSHSLTPERVSSLAEPLHGIVVGSYHDALIPIFTVMVPLGLAAALLLCFLREKALATEIEHEIPAESLAEGQVLITEFDKAPDTAAASRTR